ncbi:sigma-54-dependent Fis family transcriptional regulator [Nocardia asteroides]|uniref:sigma-54-dependent Fis family transcriptional regulator n=1 Tax=Nocardia asteroides TaxID=1824 RepID=UPI0037CA58EF
MVSTTAPGLGSACVAASTENRLSSTLYGQGGGLRRASRAREVLLTNGQWDEEYARRSGLRPEVLGSWRRSLRYGLRPECVEPIRRTGADLDGQLARIADSVVASRRSTLDQSRCALTVTDREGTVLRRWVADARLRDWLDDQSIVPSVSVDETAIGTFSAICLLDGRPVQVSGPEHFSEAFVGTSSTGVPITHPVSRRIIGSLILSCRVGDANPILLAWATELAAEVERLLLETATTRERMLLDAYLAENRDVRHPVIVLNEQTIISNATAARLLGSVDQARLWEHASQAIRQREAESQEIVLTDGTTVSVSCREVRDDEGSVGAVVKVRQAADRPASSTGSGTPLDLHGLAGNGPRWRELVEQVRRSGSDWTLITGERGTGKFAVARALGAESQIQVIDAVEVSAAGPQRWLTHLESQLAAAHPDSLLVIRHADRLDVGTATAAARLVDGFRSKPIRLLGTALDREEALLSNPLLETFQVSVRVPSLRERFEDLPVLLEALSASVLELAGEQPRKVRWMPDAVQTLTRLDWPHNVASVRMLVRDVLRDNRKNYIGAQDLPAGVVARASRRKLGGLELVEATTIIAAMREAGGNKNRAANTLGIARSTLYRKVRALGLDLSTMAF